MQFELFQQKRSALDQIILLNVFSLIAHFSMHTGQCQVWVLQLAEDFGCNHKKISGAIKELEAAKMIKCIKPYNRKTQQGAVYSLTIGYGTRIQKLWHQKPKPMAPGAKVNNINNIIRDEDALAASHPKKRIIPQLSGKPKFED